MSGTVDLVQAVWNPVTGAVEGLLKQQGYGRRVTLMSVTGPANSNLTIYRGAIANFSGAITNIYPAASRTFTGDELKSPIDFRPGEVGLFQWTLGSTAVGMTAACNLVSEVY